MMGSPRSHICLFVSYSAKLRKNAGVTVISDSKDEVDVVTVFVTYSRWWTRTGGGSVGAVTSGRDAIYYVDSFNLVFQQ